MAPDEVIAELKTLPSAFITDAMRRLGLVGWSEGVRPLSGSASARHVAGRAVTLRYGPKAEGEGKASSVYQLIREAEPGDVLVFAAGGTPCWLIGENFCRDALYQGLGGFVVDGCVRDSDAIASMDFPVFARGPGIRPWRMHLELIDVNVPVVFAGMRVRSGDIVVGDADGLAVLPPDRTEEVLAQAQEIAALEKEKEEAIRRRAPLEELVNMSAAKRAAKRS